MRDFFNQDLYVGDVVAMISPSNLNHRVLMRGCILAFTTKQLRVSYQDYQGATKEILRDPKSVVKDLQGGWGGCGQGT